MITARPMLFEEEEYRYLCSLDEKMGALISVLGKPNREYLPDCFEALASSIVAQQLSAKVAEKVWARVKETCGGQVTPERIVKLSIDELRAAGLSYNKVNYVKNIAEAALSGLLERDTLLKLPDEEIIEQLVIIKGVGRWTAEMFLTFSLFRKNVMSIGDFGIRRGLSLLYFPGQVPSPKQLAEFAERFSPCKTLASLYLWEVSEALITRLNA